MGAGTVWTIESGEYSDYRVHAAYLDQATRDAALAHVEATGGNIGGVRYRAGTLPVFDAPTPTIQTGWDARCYVRENGMRGTPSVWSESRWDFDPLDDLVPGRATSRVYPMAPGSAEIRVKGPTEASVRKVLGDRLASFDADGWASLDIPAPRTSRRARKKGTPS